MAKPTVNMPEEFESAIEQRLGYGDSKSQWVREAVALRMIAENIAEDEVGAQPELADLMRFVAAGVRAEGARQPDTRPAFATVLPAHDDDIEQVLEWTDSDGELATELLPTER